MHGGVGGGLRSEVWGIYPRPTTPPSQKNLKSRSSEVHWISSVLGIKKRAGFVAFKTFSDRRCCCICFFFSLISFLFSLTKSKQTAMLRSGSPADLTSTPFLFLPLRAHLLFYCQSDNLYSAPHQKFPTSKWCSIRSPCSRVVMGCDELGGRMPKRQDNQLYPFENQFLPEATNSTEAG